MAGKAFRPALLDLGAWRYLTLGLAVVYLCVVVVLPTLALMVAAFRKFLSIRTLASLVDERQYSLIHFERLLANPLALRSIYNTMEVGLITAVVGGVFAFIGYVNRTSAWTPDHRRLSTAVASPGLVVGSPICGPGSACRAACTARSGSWRWRSSPASCPIP